MTQELLYTSAHRGLKPGSRGFCTVVCTQAMSPPLTSALESLSAYRHIYPPGDPNAANNPIVWSHITLTVAGTRYSVLSRVGDYGLDYTQRGNKLAHHVVVEAREQTAGGPAWLLAQPGFMQGEWDGEPRIIPAGRPTRAGSHTAATCVAWQKATGDAGWAGVLAEAFLANPERQAYIIVKPGMNLLPLLVEAIALLPPERRWEVTFSTYFTNILPGAGCNWRCVLADSPEALQASRFSSTIHINLCEPLGAAQGGILVDSARTGIRPPAMHLQPPRSLQDEWTDEALFNELDDLADDESVQHDGASDAHAGIQSALNIAPLDPCQVGYAVKEGNILPPGMPPPPPPKRRRTLSDLNAEDVKRRRSRIVVGSLLALILFIGTGLWLCFDPRLFHTSDQQILTSDESQEKPTHASSEIKDGKKRQVNTPTTAADVSEMPIQQAAGDVAAKGTPPSDATRKSLRHGDAVVGENRKPAENDTAQSNPANSPAPEESPIPGKPRNQAAKLRYNNQPLIAHDRQDAFFFIEPKSNGKLQVDIGESASVEWRLVRPECLSNNFQIKESGKGAKPFCQKLLGLSPNGKLDQPLYTLSESKDAESVVIYFQEIGPPSLVRGIRWAVIMLRAQTDTPFQFVVLHSKPDPPTPTTLAGGTLTWQFEKWGEVAPRLGVENITLKLTGFDHPIAFDDDRPTAEGESIHLNCGQTPVDFLPQHKNEKGVIVDDSMVRLRCEIGGNAEFTKLVLKVKIDDTPDWKEAFLRPLVRRLQEKGLVSIGRETEFNLKSVERLIKNVDGYVTQDRTKANDAKADMDIAHKSGDHNLIESAERKYNRAAKALVEMQALLESTKGLRHHVERVEIAHDKLNRAVVDGARVYYQIQNPEVKIYLVDF